MGNLEKLVVLTVLFLSAIVLSVSLTGDGEETRAGGPLEGLSARQEERAAEEERPVLSAEVAPEGRSSRAPEEARPADGVTADPSIPRVSSDGRPRILWSRAGLEPTPMEDFMLYTCAEGDTWQDLARRFYRDEGHAPLLSAANDGMETPAGGKRVLVPVFDFRAAPARDPVEPAPRRAEPVAAERDGSEPEDAGRTARRERSPDGGEVEVYVVRPGDNLSLISKKVYGTATRWAEIYQANRDVLVSPDRLDVGTTLRIP